MQAGIITFPFSTALATLLGVLAAAVFLASQLLFARHAARAIQLAIDVHRPEVGRKILMDLRRSPLRRFAFHFIPKKLRRTVSLESDRN